jgi:hypothetical protein
MESKSHLQLCRTYTDSLLSPSESRPSRSNDPPLVLAGRILLVYFGWKKT